MSEAHDGAPEGVTETLHDAHIDDAQNETSAADALAEPGDDATAEPEASEGDPPRKKPSVQDRIDELTRDKHAERRRAEAAERELERLRGDAKPKDAEQPKEDAEPDPADYTYGETDPAYIKELGAWSARQQFAKLSREAEQSNQRRTVEQTWNDRQQSFAKTTPDYENVIGGNWDCSAPMADAIRTSDVGPAVAYHLAKNPEEARRIAGLNPLAAIRAIGRLEARFDTTSQAKPTGKPASDAPIPPPQLRGAGGRFTTPPDTQDFAAFERLADANG